MLAGIFGAPLGIRTPDLRIRSALLYPAELMALITKIIILKNHAGVKRKIAGNQIYFSALQGIELWHGTPVWHLPHP